MEEYKNRFEKSLSRINKYVEPTDDWTDEDYEHIKAVTDALQIASDIQNFFLSNHEFYGNKEELCNEAKEKFKSCHSAFRGVFALIGLKWNNNNEENAEDVISDLIKCFKEHFPNCQRYDVQLAENCLRENIGGEKA